MVFTGEVSHIKVAGREDLASGFATFEVVERVLISDIEVNVFERTLPVEALTVTEFYHNYGTSEQYHGELKFNLSFERLASSKFATNVLLNSNLTSGRS